MLSSAIFLVIFLKWQKMVYSQNYIIWSKRKLYSTVVFFILFKQIYFIFSMFVILGGHQDLYLRKYKVGYAVVLQINKVYNVYIFPINISMVPDYKFLYVTNILFYWYCINSLAIFLSTYKIHFKSRTSFNEV